MQLGFIKPRITKSPVGKDPFIINYVDQDLFDRPLIFRVSEIQLFFGEAVSTNPSSFNNSIYIRE